jgi:propionate catabolism operon transcriptional regulator
MLDSLGGNREEVARVLGISKTTLWRKLAGR